MKYINWIIGGVVVLILGYVAFRLQPTEFDPEAIGYWYSVLPPVVAVVLAFITHNVFISLFGAIVLGGILEFIPKDPGSLSNWGDAAFTVLRIPYGELTDSWNFQTLAFVVLVLSLISVVITAGGLKALILWLSGLAKDKKSTSLVTYVLGLLVFIDDYANTMLVGSSMRSLSDHHKMSREKLAFIVDATSAPVAGLAFVSTWVGYEVGLFKTVSTELNLGVDGYSMFFDALGFRFYCILMLIFVLINILMRRDFGPMAAAEHRAETMGQVIKPGKTANKSKSYAHEEADPNSRPRVRVGFVPIAFMFAYLFGGLWVDGGGLKLLTENPLALFSFTNWRDVIAASENNVTVLYQAALLGLIIAILMASLFSGLKFSKILAAAGRGVRSSLLPVLILILAWSIKTVCKELHTGPFLVASLSDYLSPVWFPVILFVVAGITAFTTGTSWGTMAILIPVAIPLAHTLDGGVYGLVTMISLGAILDGSIFGDHCSPISDTTIMSSISSGCDHMDHVKTQIPYSVLVAGVAMVSGYYFAASGNSNLLGIGIGVVALAILLVVLSKIWSPQKH